MLQEPAAKPGLIEYGLNWFLSPHTTTILTGGRSEKVIIKTFIIVLKDHLAVWYATMKWLTNCIHHLAGGMECQTSVTRSWKTHQSLTFSSSTPKKSCPTELNIQFNNGVSCGARNIETCQLHSPRFHFTYWELDFKRHFSFQFTVG